MTHISNNISAPTRAAPALVIEYRPIGSLSPDPRNVRTHPKRQIEQIAASIREFGFANPIVIDPEGRIIAGHGRLLAAKALGLTEAAFQRRRSGRSGSPTTRSRSAPAGTSTS